ncbi:hypothetical protein [Candidatus Bathycorpusculum sp.]|uniref:hypothetical protein n=1 Tax=Candidatus Bathycorpusculum sp. TaxID=2994959 RepID=UPI002821B0F9|nr:hypothetical protein [Candidatus Termitimicrobium sp.]
MTTVKDVKELLEIGKQVSAYIKCDKEDSLRLECMNSIGVYESTVTVGNAFSRWVNKLSKRPFKFDSNGVYNVKIHALKPVLREITNEVKTECNNQIAIDFRKCLNLEMFRIEIHYRMNESSLNALVHQRSSPEPFKDGKKYHLSAQLISPRSLTHGFSSVDVKDYPVTARIHIQESIDVALPSTKIFKQIRKIEEELLSDQDPHAVSKTLQLHRQHRELKKRFEQEKPMQALRELLIFLRPEKFLNYVNVIDDFRLHKCKWGSGLMEVASNISLPQEMDIMTRTDLSLDKPAAKGILEYQETAFAQEVKKILNPES